MKFFTIGISIIVLSSLLINNVSFGQNENNNISIVTENGIKSIIETDKKFYKEDEIVKMNWVIENIGSEDFAVTTTNGCHNGINFAVFDSEGKRVNQMLPSGATLISDSDKTRWKFGSLAFYAKILELMKTEPTQKYSVIIITGDKDSLVDVLKSNHGVDEVYKADSLSFVTAKIPAMEIPKIAKYDFIKTIDDGEQRLCTAAIGKRVLSPGEKINGSFWWSQLLPSENKLDLPKRAELGYYSMDVRFGKIKNSLIFGLEGTEPLPPKFDLKNPSRVEVENSEFELDYEVFGGKLTSASAYYDYTSLGYEHIYLLLYIDSFSDGKIEIKIPEDFMRKFSGSFLTNTDDNFPGEIVEIDGAFETILTIPFSENTSFIGIKGDTYTSMVDYQNPTTLTSMQPPRCWWEKECTIPITFSIVPENTVRILDSSVDSLLCSFHPCKSQDYANKREHNECLKQQACLVPENLKIKVGEEVTWVNEVDNVQLKSKEKWADVIFGSNSEAGENYSQYFTEPGLYNYQILRGMVIVPNGWILVYEEQDESIENGSETNPIKPFEIVSPKLQIKKGIEPSEVICKDGYELVFRLKNNSPICVSPNAAEKFVERGIAIRNLP